jgi:hypothetical protein
MSREGMARKKTGQANESPGEAYRTYNAVQGQGVPNGSLSMAVKAGIVAMVRASEGVK